MSLKNSFYNELVAIEEIDKFLIYNIQQGGLRVIDSEIGEFLSSLGSEDCFMIKDYPWMLETLIELEEGGFLVAKDLDERLLHRETFLENQKSKTLGPSHIGLTIGTTILCNMGCSYCFQAVRPNSSLRDEKIITGIVNFIEDMIMKAPVEKWEGISVTWFGGEPLVNKECIEKLTPGLYGLSQKFNIPYDAVIITNGILLDSSAWQFLRENHVSSLQVTIDGAKEVHDIYRPLKNPNTANYEKILENIAVMPADFSLVIRINTDKRVAASLPRLLDDFEKYGLWPQRHADISMTLAWLKAYKGADVSNMINLTREEFFEIENEFSKLKVDRFNKWAKANDKEPSKLKWRTPEKQGDCPTWVSPYSFAIDPEGGVHKCWETLHDKATSSGKEVGQEWNAEDYKKYSSYSRTTVHPTCYNCKFNPVCEGLSCSHDAVDVVDDSDLPCTPWKTMLSSYFKKMYLEKLTYPNEISFKRTRDAVVRTHSNK